MEKINSKYPSVLLLLSIVFTDNIGKMLREQLFIEISNAYSLQLDYAQTSEKEFGS